MSYPESIAVQVGGSLTEEVEHSLEKTQTSLLDLIDAQDFKGAFSLLAALSAVDLADLLRSLKDKNHEDAIMVLLAHFKADYVDSASSYRLLTGLESVEWDQSKLFVDNFSRFYVDPTSFSRDPAREKAGKWNIKIFFTYALTPERAILVYADDIADSGAKSKEAPHYGAGGLLYPASLDRANTPKMWQAKKDVIAKIEEQNFDFIFTAWAVTEQVLGMVQVGQALVVSTLPAAMTGTASTPTLQGPRGPTSKGGEPSSPKQTPILPELTQTTEENITALIADTNPSFPLTRVNAQKALRGPSGATVKVAGPGGSGADVEFRQLTPEGNVVLRREVKCIQGSAQGSFNTEVSHAADQVQSGGEVVVQVTEGTDALRLVKRFRGSRTPTQLGFYRSVNITIVDPGGTVLFSGPVAL